MQLSSKSAVQIRGDEEEGQGGNVASVLCRVNRLEAVHHDV